MSALAGRGRCSRSACRPVSCTFGRRLSTPRFAGTGTRVCAWARRGLSAPRSALAFRRVCFWGRALASETLGPFRSTARPAGKRSGACRWRTATPAAQRLVRCAAGLTGRLGRHSALEARLAMRSRCSGWSFGWAACWRRRTQMLARAFTRSATLARGRSGRRRARGWGQSGRSTPSRLDWLRRWLTSATARFAFLKW
jgi:hypothetical protein